MKRFFRWPIALLTSFATLVAMLLFDFILSLFYYLICKIPFMDYIIDFIGEILDLGLTALFAYTIAVFIWGFGHSLVEKIVGKDIEFKKSPVFYINLSFFFIFLIVFVFFAINVVMLIDDFVVNYTAQFQGLRKILMFFKAIKDSTIFVWNQNSILYRIGANSLLLSVINIFASNFIDNKKPEQSQTSN